MAICKLSAVAFAAMLGSLLLAGPVSAMPANGLAAAAKQNTGAIQEVRWVGGWRGGVGWRGGMGWRGVGWRGGWAGAGWNRSGWGRGLYAYAGPGWRRPLYAYGGPGWNRWGWRRPLLAAATVAAGVGLATAAWDSSYYADNYYADSGWNTGYYQQPYYAYAGPTWNVGWNAGWGWRGWGWRGWGGRGWW